MSGFPRAVRITRGPDIQRVLKEGKRIRTRFLDVRIAASPFEHLANIRVGLIVPKAKHTAVERNLLKRRLRELVRELTRLDGSRDVLLIARGDTYQATFEMLMADVAQVSRALQSSR